MTKHQLARVRWQLTLVEHEPVGSAQSAAWELVADVKRLSSDTHEVQLMLASPELQGADFDDISQQEDRLKVGRCNAYNTIAKLRTVYYLLVSVKVVLHWSICNANLQWYDVARKIVPV